MGDVEGREVEGDVEGCAEGTEVGYDEVGA